VTTPTRAEALATPAAGQAATEVDRHLRAVAERLAAAYVARTAPRAILLTGSAAAGGGDRFSDVDMVVYFDEPPAEERLRAARQAAGAEPGEGHKYWIGGVECDVGHVTVATVERQLADVLERFEARSLSQKALEGIVGGVALHGHDLICGWQERARAYPPELARAMVEAHLRFWPIWRVDDWVAARDMTLWRHHTLVESSHNLLGILAGLNRLYFSPAYFKRLHRFVARMAVAPDRLADRLEALFTSERAAAVADLERLVEQTVALVEARMPDVDTRQVRRDLGARRPTWRPDAL
jgi:hypothetical protein